MGVEGTSKFAYETPEGTAAALRAGRAFMQFSQEDLAEKLEINAATIGRHENAENLPENPWGRAYLLERLAALGCSRAVLGLPPMQSLALAEDQPIDPDLLAAYLRAEAERSGRAQPESPPSSGDTD